MSAAILMASGEPLLRVVRQSRQGGFSLFILLVILSLSVVIVLGGARVAVVLEAMGGSRREYDRAFEAAEAGLLDAQRDIDRLYYNNTSRRYESCPGAVRSTDVCRDAPALRGFPNPDSNGLAGYEPNSCDAGICVFSDNVLGTAASGFKFWTKTAYSDATMSAKFGQFTGAPLPDEGHEALRNTRYWIEVVPLLNDDSRKGGYLYRITAMSTGTRGAGGTTQVVVQANYDPDPIALNAAAPPPPPPPN
jgi:type IV pilus assembly protein PilX